MKDMDLAREAARVLIEYPYEKLKAERVCLKSRVIL